MLAAFIDLHQIKNSKETEKSHYEKNKLDVLSMAQRGPQYECLKSEADIVFYGGSAGGGKTFALLLEHLKYAHIPGFRSVIFRRNSTQVRNPGGMWHESLGLYTQHKGHPREAFLEWRFPSNSTIKFAHLEHEKNVYDWQGAQIPFIGFDELTHFTESQFTYMLSRNRSTLGVKPYIRGTCNPDSESWVRGWVDWYIDEEGYAIPERSGKIRYFVRLNGETHWADGPQELIDKYGKDEQPKSFTFIRATLSDNRILMEKDPAYLANLKALSRVERARLLDANWNVRVTAGSYFQAGWFEILDAIPTGWTHAVRYWDRASTQPNEANKDPDFTRGIRMLKYPNGTWIVTDLKSTRDSPLAVEKLIINTASQDGRQTVIYGEEDPGSAGKADIARFTRMLAGYVVKKSRPTTDKETRAKPVSAQCEAGNVKILRGNWNKEFFDELENFPLGKHDDIVDALSGAFNVLCEKTSILSAL
jgi:predicted phage terminase large subunit-like protein